MTKTVYDPVAVLLHWGMAVLIIALLAVGMYMSDLLPSDPYKWPLYGMHKAVGIIVLALVLVRIAWRGLNPPPTPLETQARWERVLAHVIHMLLYIAMVMMPISGYVMSAAGGHPISIFGIIDVPLLIGKNEDLGHTAKEVHEMIGNVIIALLVLHVAGAVKHHVKDKDNTMLRMAPWIKKKA